LLCEEKWIPVEQYASVYSFSNDLTAHFPEKSK